MDEKKLAHDLRADTEAIFSGVKILREQGSDDPGMAQKILDLIINKEDQFRDNLDLLIKKVTQ